MKSYSLPWTKSNPAITKVRHKNGKDQSNQENDDYSMDYQVGDILEVTGTWYGGINVNSKTGIPLCLDKDEYEEIPENTDLSHEEYERAANYWKEKDAQSKSWTRML